MCPGQGPPAWGWSRGARAAVVCVREPQRPPPLPAVDAPGYSWQRLPEQKLLGGVRGEGGQGRGGGAGGGRGRDSASDVIGSPSASQGGRPNQKNQSGAGEQRGMCGARGDRESGGLEGRAPPQLLGEGGSPPRSCSVGAGNSPESWSCRNTRASRGA
jgi:hypothetical protein